MRAFSLAAVSVALLLSVPAAAIGNETSTSSTSVKAEKAEKKVCKRLKTTGSRMEERVCLTREQWKKVDEEVAG